MELNSTNIHKKKITFDICSITAYTSLTSSKDFKCAALAWNWITWKLFMVNYLYQKLGDHQYSGSCTHTAKHGGLVPAQSANEDVEAGEGIPNAGVLNAKVSTLLVKVINEQLLYTFPLTFLAALNIMTDHPVPSRCTVPSHSFQHDVE